MPKGDSLTNAERPGASGSGGFGKRACAVDAAPTVETAQTPMSASNLRIGAE
jgi:hypothetical protein